MTDERSVQVVIGASLQSSAKGQSEDEIGRSAAKHIHDQDRMAASELRSGTFDWS